MVVKKWFLCCLILVACGCAFAVAPDGSYYEGENGELPVIFSYLPEERPYLTQNSLFPGYASAKVGTLTLEWNAFCHDENGNAFPNFHTDNISSNFIHQLYMAAGVNGKIDGADDKTIDANYRSNEATYTAGGNGQGNRVSVTLYLACVITSAGAGSTNVSYSPVDLSVRKWGATANPAVFKGTDVKLRLPATIDFYLVTREKYDSKIFLWDDNGGHRNIKLTDNEVWRDVSRWSYRMNVGYNDSRVLYRYVSKLAFRPFSLFSPTLLSLGLNYNVPLGGKYVDTWAFDFVPSGWNEQISLRDSTPQHIATATLREDRGNAGDYAVLYSFTDSSSSVVGSDFALKQNGTEGSIPFSLLFTPHGSEPLVKGRQYVWVVRNTASESALLKAYNFKLEGVKSGRWADTITITIMPTDARAANNT